MSSRRVGRSSDAGTYQSQESDAGTVRSNAESRRSARSSDSRFSALHPRRSGADSELGSVASGHHESGLRSHTPSVSTYGGRARSSNLSAGRYAGSTSTVRTLSEAGSSRTEHAAASSGTRSSIAPAQRGFRTGLPSVAETLSQAGSGRDIDLPAMLDRLSLMSEAERERDPAFNQVRSWVIGQAELARSRASQPTSTHAPYTRAPSTHYSSTDHGILDEEPDTRSYDEIREARAQRRRRRRPQLAAQIDRSTQS